MKRKRWMETDSGMKHNLSKRGQVVSQMVGICSAKHGVSMKEAAIKLDEIRISLNKATTQHWKNWCQSKNGRVDNHSFRASHQR